MALDISQLYTGNPTLTDMQLTHPTGHCAIPHPGPTGPVAKCAQAGCPADTGSPKEASPAALTEASAQATALPKTTEAKEDLQTVV